jgi:hypothetical protein
MPDPDKKDRPPVRKESLSTRASDKLNDGTPLQENPAQREYENDPSGEYRRPLTNQDEQQKATNAQDNNSPLGEKEAEGI